MNYEKQFVKNSLNQGKVLVEFTKTNGEIRSMLCTLNPELIPELTINEEAVETKRTKKDNPDVQAVWDLEKQAWRSFRFDSIIRLTTPDI